MADQFIEWMLWLAFAPIAGGVLFLLGWLRWWVGVALLLLLAVKFAKSVSDRPLDGAGLFIALTFALALLAIAAGVGFDHVLRRKRGERSGRPVQRLPVTRPLYPYALDVVPAFMSALLGGGLFAYVFYIAIAPFKDPSPGLVDLVLGLLGAMVAVIWFGAYMLLEVAVLFVVAFLLLRDLRALNLLWLAITGAVIGLAMALRFTFAPALVLAAVAIGLAGGTTAYLELRRRVARYAAPPPGAPAAGAPLPPWALAVQRAMHVAVAALRKGAAIVAAGERAASAAMGGGSRARSIAAISLALVVAVAVFQVFGHSVLVTSGYGADSVVLPAAVGALVAALLAYWATDALVTKLEDRSRQRIALVSLVLATGSLASLPHTLFA